MAIYLELPVYKTCFELAVEFARARQKMPRESRYTTAQEIDRGLVGIMVLIYRANAAREKGELIAEARRQIVEVQIRLRILNELRHVSLSQAARFTELSESVSKQLARWHRSAVSTHFDAKAPSDEGGRPESGGSRSAGASQKANPMKKCGPTGNTEATP
ncbi:MAG: four helix bundle protein [Kiritimatiellae bacterium]|nr:four helix bundle protein [Kiritimatiellia bacterium]